MGDKTQKKYYQHGQDDANSGKGKDYIRNSARILSNPRAYLPGGDNYVSEAVDYHSKGYDDGMRKHNVNISSNSKSTVVNNQTMRSNSMSNVSDIEKVIESLEDLRTEMNQWKNQLNNMIETVNDTSDELLEYDMIKQTFDRLNNGVFIPISDEITDITNNIDRTYKVQITQEISRLEVLLD